MGILVLMLLSQIAWVYSIRPSTLERLQILTVGTLLATTRIWKVELIPPILHLLQVGLLELRAVLMPLQPSLKPRNWDTRSKWRLRLVPSRFCLLGISIFWKTDK